MAKRYFGYTDVSKGAADLESRFVAANTKALGFFGDTVTDDRDKLDTLANVTLQPDGGEIDVIGAPRIASNVSIPTNVRLNFRKGAYLAPDLGATITINSPTKKWPLQKVFGGGGAVQFGSKAADAVRPEFFGAAGDGATDEIALKAWQKAHDALPAATGGTIKATSRTYMLNGAGATIANPRILCSVTKPNVFFELGSARFLMRNWSKADSDANNDAGAGTNVFSGIVFGNGVIGGGVTGGYAEGDSDGTALTNLRSRAKFVAIDGASDIEVHGLRGKLIVGNLVNARGNGGGLGWCDNVSVSLCKAEYCAESGFNYMGGVQNSTFSLNRSRFNKYHGFESGANDSTVVGNVCSDNSKDGITQVGRDSTFANNDLKRNGQLGFNFQWSASPGSDGSGNVLRGGIVKGNLQGGISGDGSTSQNEIVGVRVIDNTGEGIKLNITCTNYVIRGVTVGDTGGGTQVTGIHAVTASKLTICGGTKTFGHTTGLLVDTNSDDVTIIGNNFRDTVTIAATTTNKYIRNNRGYVTENSGTATILSGTTSILVNHGLSTGAGTLAQNFSVTPTNSMGAATKFWIDGITSTQFRINVNADPGAPTATFAWTASAQ